MTAWIELRLSGGRADYVRYDQIVEVVERTAYGQNDKAIGCYVHLQSGRELECTEMARDVLELVAASERRLEGSFYSEDSE